MRSAYVIPLQVEQEDLEKGGAIRRRTVSPEHDCREAEWWWPVAIRTSQGKSHLYLTECVC